MPGLLYFVPKIHAPAQAADVERAGLAGVLDAARLASRECQRGPGESPDHGAVLADPETDPIGYFPDRQVWEKAGELWIGRFTDRPAPGPADLRRPNLLPGYQVKLEDGNTWVIPKAHHFRDGVTLPRTSRIGLDGKVVRGQVISKWSSLAAAAERVWGVFVSLGQEPAAPTGAPAAPGGPRVERPRPADSPEGGAAELPFDEAFAIAALALGANYHLTPGAISFLGLLSDRTLVTVLRALVDVPAYLEAAATGAAAGQAGAGDGRMIDAAGNAPTDAPTPILP